jgi:hypothetical protein
MLVFGTSCSELELVHGHDTDTKYFVPLLIAMREALEL